MNEIPTRRAWAPFVGAALAMLTTGSLVVFALVAQRTSLDGFSNDRVTATRPAAANPPAITIAPVAASSPSRNTPDGGSSTEGAATVAEVASGDAPAATITFFDLVTTSSPAPRGDETVAVVPASDGGGGGDISDVGDSPNQRLAEERALYARGVGGNSDPGDSTEVVAGWDSRHGGKHSHKSHDAKDKSNKKRSKARRSRGGSHAPQASLTRSSSGSSSTARPASKPNSPRAQRSPAPASHPNAGGKGKSRGRGHGRR